MAGRTILGVGVAVCSVLAVAACDGGSGSSSSTTTPPDTSSGSGGARLGLRGAPGLRGPLTSPSVRCNFPALDGQSIAVLAEPRDPEMLARVAISRGKVEVIVSSGSGDSYHERAFEGRGVTRFDAARGASVDSTLADAAAGAGTTPGDIGGLTSIEGAVGCGEQTPGSSTVTITGDTAAGPVAAATLDPVRVECDSTDQGDEVVALGLMSVGTSRVLLAIGLTSDGAVTVNESTSAGSRRYLAEGSSTITPTAADVDAQVVAQDTASPAPTLHVEGDLMCGLHADG